MLLLDDKKRPCRLEESMGRSSWRSFASLDASIPRDLQRIVALEERFRESS